MNLFSLIERLEDIRRTHGAFIPVKFIDGNMVNLILGQPYAEVTNVVHEDGVVLLSAD